MARSIWSGSITFGLVTIPVKLYTAVSDRKIPLHLLHEKDGEPVHYKRVCEKGHELEWNEIVKGYEFEKGKWVTFTDEELAALDTPSLKTIDIENFAPAEQIDPVFYDKTYYVSPQEGGTKAYRLLSEAMEAEGLIGICKVAIRDKEHLAAIRLKDGRLALQTMHWPDEVRDAEAEEHESKRVRVRDAEVKMARQLVQQLTSDFNPDNFHDDYARALEDLARRKIEGEEITEVEVEEEPSTVVDLMEALRQSVESARSGKKPAKRSAKKDRSARGDDDLDALSKDELVERARELDVQGRSGMNKSELIRAIQKAS